jgi:hypothetical protein
VEWAKGNGNDSGDDNTKDNGEIQGSFTAFRMTVWNKTTATTVATATELSFKGRLGWVVTSG